MYHPGSLNECIATAEACLSRDALFTILGTKIGIVCTEFGLFVIYSVLIGRLNFIACKGLGLCSLLILSHGSSTYGHLHIQNQQQFHIF